MQEKINNTRNISKKRSENIKITKKTHEIKKLPNNLITSHIYNNTSTNNSLLLNKSEVKIEKKSNIRNISQSTKYMKTKDKEKDKSKIDSVIKSKNKYSITREKDREVYKNINTKEKQTKSKKKYNTNIRDILITKNKEINSNHSFNHIKKMQNVNSYSNSFKNIEPSYSNEIYNLNSHKNNKIPRFKKYDKKNITLPFFYHIKKSEIKCNYKRKKLRCGKIEYKNILKDINSKPNIEIANKLLYIYERDWMEELKENSIFLEKNKNNENGALNEYIKERIIIQEDFNWFLWSMGIICWHLLQNKLDKNCEIFFKLNTIFNVNDITKWKEGFIYNGVYFILLDKVENYDKIKMIKREIKSLNLLFLDYIQLIDYLWQNKICINNNTKPFLLDNIIFPLLSLLELTDYYLFCSLALEPSYEKDKAKMYALNGEEYFNKNNYYNDFDIYNYNMDNLKQSPLFANLTENNLLNLNNEKFLLINIANDLHPLMIGKENNNENIENEFGYKKNIYLKYPIITHIISKEEKIFNKAFLNYFECFVNYLQNNKYILDIPNLEYEMNKFGINKCFYLLIISKIKFNNSYDFETNNNICSLIKIYILVKFLTKINDIQYSNKSPKDSINNYNIIKDNKSEISYTTTSHKTDKSNSRKNIKYSEEKKNFEFNNSYNNSTNIKNKTKRGIEFISQLILTILNPSPSIKINMDDLIYKLLYQSNIYIEKFKNLNMKLFSSDTSHLYEPRSFLKSLISSARKHPFIFLKQIETKFNVIFNYEIKYRTSICIENFMKYFNKEIHIIEKEPQIITSYINAEEIGSYLMIKCIYENSINNNMKRKGNKIVKNISSENMEFFYGRLNYDNFSLLNRSIIHNRNSNFQILNSSKEKFKKYQFNNVPINTDYNTNKNNITSNNIIKERNNKTEAFLPGNNFKSLNSNETKNNTEENNNILNNYKTEVNKNNKKEENYDLDMYVFDDEESEKSLNISNEDSNIPANYNKKRNTTNLNNSKYNLNNINKSNENNSTNKTLNTLNYNTNTSNSINNSKNLYGKSVNKMTPSGSLGKLNQFSNKYKNNLYWQSLFNNYHIKFPNNLYKVYFDDLKSNLPIYKYLSMYYSFYSFLPYTSLNDIENSNISKLLNKQKDILENIFSDIICLNPNSTYVLITFYIYYFLNCYFIEKDNNHICKEILSKINSLLSAKILYKKLNYQIIINLLNGLYGTDNFLKEGEYFNKALILSLIEYGEPRGRNNDGRSIMIFPAWKTGRNFLIMDNNEIINENYKEMYKALLYYNENKTKNKNNIYYNINYPMNNNTNRDSKDINKNIMNDLYREYKYDIKNYKKAKKYYLNLGISNNNSNNVKTRSIYTNNNRANKPFTPLENKSSADSYKKKKNNSGYIQNYFMNKNDDLFFNIDDEDMLERPSKGDLYDDININDNNFKKNLLNDKNINNKYISRINSDETIMTYFKENSFFPEIKFPSMGDKSTSNIFLFFFSEKFFIYLIKSIFSIINFSSNELSLTEEYMKNSVFEENRIITKNNKKVKWKLENVLNENLYYKLYNQSNIIISFGHNSHCETGHSDYKLLYIPRVLYQLKNKEIISIKSGWEHNICQDKDKMLYSFGNNSRCQCGFDILDNNKIIKYPKNIMELNDKSINEISCGNEHTLALTEDGDVYSWGSTSDGVLGREIKGYEKALGIGKPGKIPFFIKNDIKIRHISSGSIHNLCLDFKSNLYSWGCSKGGQLGLDEKELAIIYKQNCLNNSNSKEKDKSKSEIENDNNFCLKEPKLIKSLKDIDIIKISSGEAHNAALSIDGKCYVWGLGSNGQLGLGFCEDCFPYGEGMKKTREFVPTIVKEFDKKNENIIKVFCGKTFTIFLNKKHELYSTGINDLNQCGIDNKLVENINLCNDIVTPIKIEMFMRMKIINISCGESHVLAITEDNDNRMLFSWGSNRFGQLGQGVGIKKCTPRVVNYFLHYNNSIVSQVSCGAFHSLALIKIKEEDKYRPDLEEKYIFGIIDKYEDYNFEIGI